MVERSANWPQHLAAYLNGALTVLKPKAVGPDAIGSVRGASLSNAIALGDHGRKVFYGRRLERLTNQNSLFEEYAIQVAQWLRDANTPLRGFEITRRLMSAYDLSAEEGTQFQHAAEHGGLLVVNPASGTCSTAIPSFVGHLLGETLPPISELKFPAEEDEYGSPGGP